MCRRNLTHCVVEQTNNPVVEPTEAPAAAPTEAAPAAPVAQAAPAPAPLPVKDMVSISAAAPLSTEKVIFVLSVDV